MPATPLAEILDQAGVACETAESGLGVVARISASSVADALAALVSEGFDYFVDLFGTDTGEAIELTYHVRRLAAVEDAYLRAVVAYDGEAPSSWRVYPAALYPEREAAELLGITFAGHPNPKRLLTVDGAEPFLRKSVAIRGEDEVALP